MLSGGRLRLFARSMAATLIMYYTESHGAGEARAVTHRMEAVAVELKIARDVLSAQQTLATWAKAIKER